MTGAVASQRVTEAREGALSAVGNRATSAKAEGRLTARATARAAAKAGLSDPVVPSGRAIAQRIKGTLGITGLSPPRVHIDGAVWHLDVGSSHPGAGEGPKGPAVRRLKWYVSWVQNVVRQFGLYPSRAQECCGEPSLVREDRDGPTSGVPAVLPRAAPGSYVGTGEPLKASKREAPPKTSTPRSQDLRRAVRDEDVDRRQVQGGQPSQPSRTNRPGGLTVPDYSGPTRTNRGSARRTDEALHLPLPLNAWPAAMARGPHPFPSRTRSLSLAARMVLPGPPGGRVRRRRLSSENASCCSTQQEAFSHPPSSAIPGGPLPRAAANSPAAQAPLGVLDDLGGELLWSLAQPRGPARWPSLLSSRAVGAWKRVALPPRAQRSPR